MLHQIGSILTVAWALLAVQARAQDPAAWQDPAKHQIQFVEVEPGVRLEALDWGGSGRPVVLLAGSGNSAHVFDDIAPKLTGSYHVYGITRRGHGASSQPASGYDDQRLADDVLQVLDALHIALPVLVGHSMAGGELTTLGNQHSDRLSALVYLDALADPRDEPGSDPTWIELQRKLPPIAPPAPPSVDASKSFSGYREWEMRSQGWSFPESEWRNIMETNPDGTRGRFKSPRRIGQAIGEGQKKRDYSAIRVPVMAFFEFPRSSKDLGARRPGDPRPRNAEERAAIGAFADATKVFMDRWTKNLQSGVPNARLVDLPGAGHYVFLTRESEVVQGIWEFIASLP